MLPKYKVPLLNSQTLTDDILNAALESEEYTHVSIQTARDVCYMYMSHTAVWDEELEKFCQEAADDLPADFIPLEAVAALAKAAETNLMWEEIRKYRQEIKEDEVSAAMSALKIEGNAKTMTFLLAAFVVGGHTALSEYNDIMHEEAITERDVIAVKEEMNTQVKTQNWILADDDCAQYVRMVNEYTGKTFELWQVCELVESYVVAHATINIDNYSSDEINEVLNFFGYQNLDEFVEMGAPGPIERHKDGSLDKDSPHYIIEWQLIAEMLFETEALTDALVPGRHWEDFDSAAAFIRQEIGVCA